MAYPKEVMCELTKTINHYKFLDRYLDAFWIEVFGKSLDDMWCSGIVSAHGDKGSCYRRDWENAGISYYEGMMIYMLTYTKEMNDEQYKSKEWVINNYSKYKPLIDAAINKVDKC